MSATQDLRHDFEFTSKDGLRIACVRWQCIGPARGVIQIGHGMGEHSGRYSELIAGLQGASLVVYANDGVQVRARFRQPWKSSGKK